MYFSPNLVSGILSDGFGAASLAGAGDEPCVAHNEPSLVSESSGWQSEPEGFQNLFLGELGESGPGNWHLVNRTRTSVVPADAWLEDASTEEGEELSHIAFEEEAQLTEGALVGDNLYEWFNGEVRLVTFLPDGQPTVGQLANGAGPSESHINAAAAFTNAVSADGSRVFFTAGGNLYVRLHAEREPQQGALDAAECAGSSHACTIQVDASQTGGPGGGATFLTANTAGTKVFFTDSPGAQLTSDTEPVSGENLYEYEVDTGRLIDLTGGEADVNVLGYSGFGEQSSGANDLYFVAEGVLGTAGPNLFVVSNSGGASQTAFIAALSADEDKRDWGTSREVEAGVSGIELLTTRVSPDGRLIAFTSTEAQAIAGYDNMPAQPEACSNSTVENGSPSGLCREIFLYEAGASKPTCVSCHQGASPTGPNVIAGPEQPQDRRGPGYLTRYVQNDGSVFFNSPDALVPEDINGVSDVYEYHEGHVHLISSGTSTESSNFVDASAEGTDVFFTTSERLLRIDVNEGSALYDARRDGGFAEPARPSECDSSGCRTAPLGSPLELPTPASAVLAGSGNVAPSPPAKATSKPKKLTPQQMLDRELKTCKRRANKRKRAQCERQARRRYGPKKPTHHRAKPSLSGRGGGQ